MLQFITLQLVFIFATAVFNLMISFGLAQFGLEPNVGVYFAGILSAAGLVAFLFQKRNQRRMTGRERRLFAGCAMIIAGLMSLWLLKVILQESGLADVAAQIDHGSAKSITWAITLIVMLALAGQYSITALGLKLGAKRPRSA